MRKRLSGRARRKARIRKRVHGTALRPRLTVFRSDRHIYAQVVDDMAGNTLAAVSTLNDEVAAEARRPKVEFAKAVGATLARTCIARGVSKVVFDRNGYGYHGRVRALADAAREAGLDF